LLTSHNSYLNRHERDAYFKRIYDTLTDHCHEFGTTQYRASLAYRLQPDTTTEHI
jgi:hypothetical protein